MSQEHTQKVLKLHLGSDFIIVLALLSSIYFKHILMKEKSLNVEINLRNTKNCKKLKYFLHFTEKGKVQQVLLSALFYLKSYTN